ncbi:DUF4429 domain-containing protein [Streptomyces sp. NPDC056682]|uniref:DUF4429 domain-containing protein n=1 Tax=Streptomyces sp. NPDC056682 TaxID=3345909 RepID=UPI0036C1757B
MDVQGRTGRIQWDGTAITISRRTGEIRIPVEQISAVEWHPAGALSVGWLRLIVPGTPPPRVQRRPAQMARIDPYAVVFSRGQQPAFEELRYALGM